jgi:hypothetical protein
MLAFRLEALLAMRTLRLAATICALAAICAAQSPEERTAKYLACRFLIGFASSEMTIGFELTK